MRKEGGEALGKMKGPYKQRGRWRGSGVDSPCGLKAKNGQAHENDVHWGL